MSQTEETEDAIVYVLQDENDKEREVILLATIMVKGHKCLVTIPVHAEITIYRVIEEAGDHVCVVDDFDEEDLSAAIEEANKVIGPFEIRN